MIEPKLQARARRQHPLPRLSCEHVIAGTLTAARIIRDGVLLSVCPQCWTTRHLLRVTMDGKLIAPADETAWTNSNMTTVKQIAGYDEDQQ